MPEFSLAWNRRRLEWRHDPEKSRWQLECVLCERVLLEGRPQLRIVARLAGKPANSPIRVPVARGGPIGSLGRTGGRRILADVVIICACWPISTVLFDTASSTWNAGPTSPGP
jgi:hypothetical protein